MISRTACLATLLAFSVATSPSSRAATPDAIVLGIADGTSQELLTAARLYQGGASARLALESFPQTAIVRTPSASDLVTDSGAAATAMARGIKADNRVVGQENPQSSSAPASLLDLAKKAGWSTAVVTDDTVTGATPASFLIEHGNRDDQAAIAAKIVEQLGTRADFVVGGGTKWFADLVAEPTVIYNMGERDIVTKTQKRLAGLAPATFHDWEKFVASPGEESRPVLATFFPEQFPYYADGTRTLRLRDMVARTVEKLQARKKPFLLIFEAALPDKACHKNNARRAMVEVLEFDATLAWLKDHLGPNALILATTDHNNGGFTINSPAPIRWKGDDLLRKNPLLGCPPLTWASGPGFHHATENKGLTETDPAYVQPALLEAKSAYHSGGDVWLIGSGPCSEGVRGYLENTDIYRLVADALPKKK